MPKILFATHNPWKDAQFRPVFSVHGFEMLTLQDVSLEIQPLEEMGQTPLENARLKARQVHSDEYPWAFGDDAGLEIDALNGEPGLQARRWGGLFKDEVDDQTWLAYLLERMKDVPAGQRTARFVSAWVLIDPGSHEHSHTMYWPFEIATDPIRPMQPGSPISAVRIGPEDDLRRRQIEINLEWRRWGILEILLTRYGG